ncbi:glutamine synthetase [Streptomyces sp. Ru73]|uniref:glutamine synthetase family protein n=1 Tax=Streptomyces sp. Ru73 TaxID=2080748 RepID=UPI000CDD9C42|nr:glutamine synthetase family protein [Streptomyces sp. Ru73]POX43021.1 glutamine synthetase [Streptomyces sp. Ru73]
MLTPSSQSTIPDSRSMGAASRLGDVALTLDELRTEAAAGRLQTVMLAVPDLNGRLKGKRYAIPHFLDHVADGRAEMCGYVLATDLAMRPIGGPLASWQGGYPDLAVRPDLSTLRRVPWLPGTALVHADAHHPDGTPVAIAPRQVLQHQLDRLAAHGLWASAGLEAEFILCHPPEGGRPAFRPVTENNLDYALDAPHAPGLDQFVQELPAALTAAGLPLEAIKTEGAPGQVEVTFRHGDAMTAADTHTVLKHGARVLAERCGLTATFMAAPTPKVASGLHIHLSLWRDDDAALAGPTGLSLLGKQAIAGLVDVLPDLAPLYAPTVNSYKRFSPYSYAPTRMGWGVDNRTCAVRLVDAGPNLHLEVRVPGADANPYLALAAAVAAMLNGIEHNLHPPAPCTGDAYAATRQPPLPPSLEAATIRFSESPPAHKAFGSEAVEHYALLARTELDAHRTAVTDIELTRGLTHS